MRTFGFIAAFGQLLFAAASLAAEDFVLPAGAKPVVLEGPDPLSESDAPDWLKPVRQYAGLPAILPDYGDPWSWQILPNGLMYKSYLAGVREPRLASVLLYEFDRGWLWDFAVGGRVGLLRHGNHREFQPEGWQLDVEGAAFPRISLRNDRELEATDFRAGVPITWREGPFQAKLAYYHFSSHMGDEFVVRTGATPTNYAKDAFVLGGGYFPLDELRVYGELGYAFSTDGPAEPWELQFGAEYSPPHPTEEYPVPYCAINVHLREEVNWGGNVNMMVGLQWRGYTDHVFRTGLQYFNGKSSQRSFLQESEQLFGFGLRYEY